MEKNNKKRNRYESKVYLGKELYNEMTQYADTLGLSLSALLRMLINTGHDFAKSIERSFNDGNK